MLTISFRQLLVVAGAAFGSTFVVQLLLPCDVWRWIVPAVYVSVSLFAIAAVGRDADRSDVSELQRSIVIFVSLCALVAAPAIALGGLC